MLGYTPRMKLLVAAGGAAVALAIGTVRVRDGLSLATVGVSKPPAAGP